MPARGAFASAADSYGTLLHELGHWTGHESRLHRQFGRWGDEAYAREELRAEWASAMVSAQLGIPSSTENHAAHLASWVQALKNDKHEVFRAARDATQIAAMLCPVQEDRPAVVVVSAPPVLPVANLAEEQRYRQIGEAMVAQARAARGGPGAGIGIGR